MRASVHTRFLAALVVAYMLPVVAAAATITFSPASGSYAAGKTFSVKVQVDPGSDSINASDGALSFDTSLLQVTSVAKDGSVFSLWTADPKFSNTDGAVEWSGGSPSGVSSKGTIVSITFKAKKAGTAAVKIDKASVLAADGKGTDVYQKGADAAYSITDAPPPDAQDTAASDTTAASDSVPADIGGVLPIAPVVTSSTHPKPDGWYATSTVQLAWKPTADVLAQRVLFSQNASDTPTQNQKIASTTATYFGVADGTWYFHIQYKNDAGWGPVANVAVNIDTVPPSEFDIALAPSSGASDPPKLAFKADDALSGVVRYEINFGTTTVGSVKAKDVSDGTWMIPPQGGGDIAVTVKAFDAAGNMRSATRMLTIPAVAKPDATDETAPKQPSNWPEHILVVVLAIAFGGLCAWYYKNGKDSEAERARVLARVVEVREKNDRVFSAMREEFEQMVQDFDAKPQLTPEERNLLEGIKEVLDISEGLLDSSLEELKREVRGK